MLKKIAFFLIKPILSLLLCLVLGMPAMAGQTMDMADAVLRALDANPQMEGAEAGMDGAEAARRAAIGEFFPSATVTYGYTRLDHVKPTRDTPRASRSREEDNWNLTFNLHENIFTGFRRWNAYEKSELNKEYTKAYKDNVTLSLTITVQENFLALLKAREQVRSAQDSVTRLGSQLKVTQAFYEVGLKPRLDVLQAEVNLAQAQDDLLQAENVVETQIARLNTLLQEDLDSDVEYVGELAYVPFNLTLEECLDRAYKNRPDMILANKAMEMGVRDERIAASALYPQIAADFNWSSWGDDMAVTGGDEYHRTEFSEWSATVGLSWTIDFGVTWYTMREAQHGVRQLRAEERRIRQEATYDVKSKHLNIHEAEQRIKVARKALEQAKEAYRMAVARYQAQVGTNTDVLDAQASLTSAEANLTAAMADYLSALANIYVAIGESNPSLLPTGYTGQ